MEIKFIYSPSVFIRPFINELATTRLTSHSQISAPKQVEARIKEQLHVLMITALQLLSFCISAFLRGNATEMVALPSHYYLPN